MIVQPRRFPISPSVSALQVVPKVSDVEAADGSASFGRRLGIRWRGPDGTRFILRIAATSLLPEDTRIIRTSLAQVQATLPGLIVWLRRVFWVMGGYMFAAGLLTFYLAITAFRARTRGAGAVTALAGLTSIGLMAAVNFLIHSDFRWPILSFAMPYCLALILYQLEAGPE